MCRNSGFFYDFCGARATLFAKSEQPRARILLGLRWSHKHRRNRSKKNPQFLRIDHANPLRTHRRNSKKSTVFPCEFGRAISWLAQIGLCKFGRVISWLVQVGSCKFGCVIRLAFLPESGQRKLGPCMVLRLGISSRNRKLAGAGPTGGVWLGSGEHRLRDPATLR